MYNCLRPTEVQQEAIRHWGIDAQLYKLAEELSELQTALLQYCNKKKNKEKNLEQVKLELADVLTVIPALWDILNPLSVELQIQNNIIKLQERMGQEQDVRPSAIN